MRDGGSHPEAPRCATQTLSARLGRTISPANLRQLLHRARERFAELLLDEVCQSLEGASIEQVEE